MTVDDSCQSARQVVVRVYVVEFAGFDQRCDDAPVFGSGVVTGKQGVFAV